MTWIQRRHECGLPPAEDGGVWECDECGRVWYSTFRSPAFDFLADRPMRPVWMWQNTSHRSYIGCPEPE